MNCSNVRPWFSRHTQWTLLGLVLLLLIILGVYLALEASRRERDVLSFPGIPTVTPNGLSFAISNQSDSLIFCIAYPPQIGSNGIWLPDPRPRGSPFIVTLGATQSLNLIVSAPSQSGLCRIPVRWGLEPKAGQRGRIKHWIVTRLQRLQPGLVRQAQTNYSQEIRMP